MKVKERVIRESIDKIKAEIAEIDAILDASPLTEIINIRMEAQKFLNENVGIKARMSNEFNKKISELAKREKQQFELAEKQKDSLRLITRKSKIDFELGQLRSELYNMGVIYETKTYK